MASLPGAGASRLRMFAATTRRHRGDPHTGRSDPARRAAARGRGDRGADHL